MKEQSKSKLHQRKLTRARYRLRSHKETGLSLRNRTIPPRSLSNCQKKNNKKKVATKSASTKKAITKKAATKKVATKSTRSVAAESTITTTTTTAAAASTNDMNEDKHKWVKFQWELHPNAWACLLRTPYLLYPPRTKTRTESTSTQQVVTRTNAITTKTNEVTSLEPVIIKRTVAYIDRDSTSQKRGGYIIGSDPSCDFLIRGTNIAGRSCIIYSQTNAHIESGKSFLKPILSNISSEPIYVRIIKKETETVLLPQRSMVLRSEYAIRFTKELTSTEPHLIFFMKIFPVPSFGESYELGDLIGTGNFAEVNVATDNSSNEVVAVKTIKISEFKRTIDALSQFSKEVGTMLSLDEHPGVIQLKNIFEEYGFYYIVMDYAPRGELYNFIKKTGYLSESTTRIIFYQLFHIIKFLHGKDIVHRDIKPENILLTNDNTLQVKLCDFGLSTLHCTNMKLLTVCGTVVYVAPEILTRDPEDGYGKSCDLWSLGVVLYTCLHGYPPFFGKDLKDEVGTLDMVKKGKFQFTEVGKSGKEISDEAKDLISRLLTVNTAKRISIDDALVHPWMQAEREKTLSEISKIDERYLPADYDVMEVC